MIKNNKCVYVYLDHRKPGKYIYDDLEFDFEPIYVGKGNSNRPNRHKYLYKKYNTRFYSKIQSIFESSNKLPDYIIHKSNLTEDEANNLEVELIKKIGRIEYDGTLTNLSDGGEGQSGWKMSDEAKLKKSISMTGKILGPHSEETRNNISKSKIGKPSTKKGTKMSKESKEKMSLAKKGKYLGEDNWNYKRVIENPTKDTWELTDIDGNKIIIESLNNFCKENNLNVSCMKDVSSRRHKKHKIWISVVKLTNNFKRKKSE